MTLPAALRASRNTDAGLFYDVTAQTMRVHVIAAGGVWEEEPRRRESAEDSVNPGASVIVVGEVDAGILIVERLPNEVHLLMLCLLPSHQGRGIGSSLVSALQREAAARRVPLLLDVLKVNPARRFYERLGLAWRKRPSISSHMRRNPAFNANSTSVAASALLSNGVG
jgi:ribosomal protein S18 acetylase RimI-like enzyme